LTLSSEDYRVKSWKFWIMPILVVTLASVVVYDHVIAPRLPNPAVQTVNGITLGKKYSTVVLTDLSDAWTGAAQSVSDGKSMAEAQKTFQDQWQAARTKSFSAIVAPEFAKVLPEGAEPKSPEDRAAVVQLWRDFAKGLKGGR
jgi:hypothetical protein